MRPRRADSENWRTSRGSDRGTSLGSSASAWRHPESSPATRQTSGRSLRIAGRARGTSSSPTSCTSRSSSARGIRRNADATGRSRRDPRAAWVAMVVLATYVLFVGGAWIGIYSPDLRIITVAAAGARARRVDRDGAPGSQLVAAQRPHAGDLRVARQPGDLDGVLPVSADQPRVPRLRRFARRAVPPPRPVDGASVLPAAARVAGDRPDAGRLIHLHLSCASGGGSSGGASSVTSPRRRFAPGTSRSCTARRRP